MPEETNTQQVSIKFLFLVTAVVAIAAVASNLIGDSFGYESTFLVLTLFVAAKSAIFLFLRNRQLLAHFSFLVCFASTLLFFCFREIEISELESIDFVLMPLVYMAVPTASYILDFAIHKSRTPNFLLIRSVIEIAILTPIWMCIAVLSLLLMGFG